MNKGIICLSLILLTSIAYCSSTECVASEDERLDCGYMGIDQSKCEEKGCCWTPTSTGGVPWCYHPGHPSLNCPKFDKVVSDPGFTDSDVEKMKGYFRANINIQGKGGIAAANDHSTPGGDYFFHWARDGALSMKSYMLVYDMKYDEIKKDMDAYVDWVVRAENKFFNGVDIRIEPRFYLPDGNLFTGGWCRPQTDAPGLRATTLSMYGQVLLENGQEEYAKGKIFNSIKHDLEWVMNNWSQDSCDLWEEVRNNDFFWGRYTMRKGLLESAIFMDKIGQSDLANQYRNKAKEIEGTLDGHWNGKFIYESRNREKDSAVISALVEGYADDDFLSPLDPKIAGTLKVLNSLFCKTYSINIADSTNEVPGVLHGRYEGDGYAGGNPWVLTTANVAKIYYKGAAYLGQMAKQNKQLTFEQYNSWVDSLGMPQLKETFLGNKELALATSLTQAGDSVLQRIYYHVKGDDCHLNEQIDRNSGKQTAARDLTWSYSSVLVALKYRKEATEAIELLSYIQ